MPSNNSGLAAGRLDRHSDVLGFESSKPDERKREEARLARANQRKPLAEPETHQVVQIDTFSRVDVPSSETDHMAKKIQEVLGPFTSCLRMDGYIPPKQPVVDTGQQSTGHSLSNSIGTSVRNSAKPPACTPSETKRPSNSQPKQSFNILQPTLSKPTAKHQALNPTPVSNQTVPPSSSPVAQMLSPRPSKENPVGLTSKEGMKDSSQQVKEHTPPPLTVSSKPKAGSSSVVAKSPAKDVVLSNSSHPSHAISTLMKPSKQAAFSGELLFSSPPTEVTSQPAPPLPPSSSRDHPTNHQSLNTPKQPHAAPSSAPSSSTVHPLSMSPALPASAHTSPSTHVKASSSPHQRPKSVTPPKSSVPGLNGLNTQHSKLSSSLPAPRLGSLSVSSVEKSKSLKLQIPNETNALSKSDLNNIFKEMTEVQPLHSAIETPQKLAERMSFNVSLATIHETLPSKDNLKPTVIKDSPDVKQDKTKGNVIVKDESSSATTTPSVEAKSFNPEESSSATAKAAEVAQPAVTEARQEERTADLPADGEAMKQEPSMAQQEVAPKDVAAAVECGASAVGGVRKYGKSTGKTLRESNDSLLAHDLDLSEDSDAESATEDNTTSASQSKKGKVISTSLGAPVKRAQSIESSSSSSSSGSDSDSDSASEDDHEDEEDADKELDKEKSVDQKKSERRSSSSSSNTSSDSSSESDSEEGEEDEEEKIEADEAIRMASEKTPSPVYNKPASVGTPNTVDNQDTNKSWRLEHFIPSTKKNSTSPVSASPSKPVSPPSIGSLTPALQTKDPAPHPRTLREIGPCVSMPFDILVSAKHSDEESCNRNADDDNDDGGEVFKSKPSQLQSVRKSSSSSVSELKTKVDDRGKHWSKEGQSMGSPPIKKQGLSSASKTSGPDRKQVAPSGRSVERNSSNKKRHSRTGTSSDDEIDVVGYTPEKSQQQPNKMQDKSKQPVTVIPYNGLLSSGSDEDNNESLSADKNAPNHQPKHHKRKDSGKGDNSSCIDTFKDTPSLKGATAVAKPSVLPSDLESMYRPPNLLSPIHSAYSPLPEPSTKPLPSFQTSFSPAPTNAVTALSPVVTVSKHGDGVPPAPRIVIRLSNALLNEKQLRRLKEKKDKIRNGGKPSKQVKNVADTLKIEACSESQKDARVPPISDIKSLSNVTDNSSIKENDQAAVRTASKMSKRKAMNSEADGTSHVPASLNHKMKKSHKEPSLEPTSTSSTSSVNSDTASAPDSKSNRLPNLSTDSILANNKSSQSNAVKNLDFASNIPTDSSDDPRTDQQKSSKRKMDNGDESLSKKVKPDASSEMNPSNTPSQPASIRSRRDSAASNSSKGSQQSNKKTSRRSSTGINKNGHNNNINNNNNIDKSSGRISNNGPDLPFHQYVNGNCRVPSNLPSPQPVETQLQSTEHYLARAKEHKHLADNQRDRLARFEPYLRSGLNFFLAGYTLEHSKKDLNASYNLYNDTSNLLQYVIRMRANSSSNPDSSDRERKLIVLIIRLRSFLNHRLYTLRKPEVSKFKKVIDSEQSKHHSSSSTPATSAAAAAAASSASSSSNKAHAPSPHQSSWNKNSTGTPSPMSPTPSPATSVSSQGSCELVPGKIPNGTSQISPSPGMVSVQQRVHTVTQRYFALTSHIVKALELWDQADAEARGLEDFFSLVDAACGVLTFHSDPPTIVRYMKHALRLLSL